MTHLANSKQPTRPDEAQSSGLPDNVHSAFSRQGDALNTALLQGFSDHQEDADVRRSHLFNGRYENIYLTAKHIPQIKDLLDEACEHASRILGDDDLKAGCWFNHMPPGAVTTVHSHDDDDELLSAVYYISVADNSGKLIIHTNGGRHCITPRAGMFVFFKPDVVHEVSENMSAQDRLSIWINFGRRKHGRD